MSFHLAEAAVIFQHIFEQNFLINIAGFEKPGEEENLVAIYDYLPSSLMSNYNWRKISKKIISKNYLNNYNCPPKAEYPLNRGGGKSPCAP